MGHGENQVSVSQSSQQTTPKHNAEQGAASSVSFFMAYFIRVSS
jgi:hypothetical protein